MTEEERSLTWKLLTPFVSTLAYMNTYAAAHHETYAEGMTNIKTYQNTLLYAIFFSIGYFGPDVIRKYYKKWKSKKED